MDHPLQLSSQFFGRMHWEKSNRSHPGAVLENSATLEGGAVFFLNNHVCEKNGASDQSGNNWPKRLWSRFYPQKGKKWFHHITSGAILMRYYFGSYLAPFHEYGTNVSKRYYFSSSEVPFSTFFSDEMALFFKRGPNLFFKYFYFYFRPGLF